MKSCKFCRMTFKPVKYWQVFDSAICRKEYHKQKMRKALAMLKEKKA